MSILDSDHLSILQRQGPATASKSVSGSSLHPLGEYWPVTRAIGNHWTAIPLLEGGVDRLGGADLLFINLARHG